MIKNPRQLGIAERKLRGLMATRSEADSSQKAHWDAYTRLIDELTADITEFENLREGKTRIFDLQSLDALGEALIKARLARGWTHRDLADSLGVSQQVIQRDEVRDFENCGLARLAEVLDALGFVFEGRIRPKEESPTPRSGMSTSGDVLVGHRHTGGEHLWPVVQLDSSWPNWKANIDDWSKAADLPATVLAAIVNARAESSRGDGDTHAD